MSAMVTTPQQVKLKLYRVGVDAAVRFLKHNDITLPLFFTYAEADSKAPEFARRMLSKVRFGPQQGTGTGLYAYNCVFVNVPVTALPQQYPARRNWSWPGYKVDRTAIGVVAHETGHHIELALQVAGRITPTNHGAVWRELLKLYPKTVSGYDKGRPPSEAWAESLRLFILNPKLLEAGLPERYLFIRHEVGLEPTERRAWQRVLLNNPPYVAAAERWILQRI